MIQRELAGAAVVAALVAAVFAVGFLMRPLGAWLLGRYADRHGRQILRSVMTEQCSVNHHHAQ